MIKNIKFILVLWENEFFGDKKPRIKEVNQKLKRIMKDRFENSFFHKINIILII